jgi:Ca-activated chloride channel homolog
VSVVPEFNLHELTLAHSNALYLLAIPAIVLLWGIICAGEFRRVWAPLMRAIVLALFVIALSNPETVMRSEGAARPAVVDASGSITPSMRAWTANLLRKDLTLRGGDPALTFATNAVSGTIGGVETDFESGKPCAECQPNATNLEGALLRLASDPDAHGGPAVLVTDGWENQGDAGRAVNALLAAQIRLDIFTPPGAKSVPNVAMTELALPPALTKAAPFALGVTMQNLNAGPVNGTISIYRDDAQIEQRRVTLKPGDQRFDFPVRTEATGLASYAAVFKPDHPAQDTFLEDDSLKGWVGVGAQRKVLILTDNTRDAQYLEMVVRRMGLDPTVVVAATGEWNGSLSGYDAILINNVASARIAPAAQSAMAGYVERGGSLAMIGGDSSFGLGGYAASPLATVMPVLMKPPQHRERKRALVLIIDKSGSMGRDNKLTYAKAAAATVTKSLNDADLVSVIGFDSQPFVVVPLAPLSQTRGYFNQMIGQLTAHGQTYLIPALRQAAHDLADSDAQEMHVIILTDGMTGGTPDEYYDVVSKMHHEMGATISAIAVGREANVDLLQAIAHYGGGAYYQTDSATNLPELFVQDYRAHGGETTMVEKSFSPHTVASDSVLKDLAGRQLPALLGYVSTDLKPRADLSVYIDRGGTREPVVATWKYGAGKALAVTTDASGRWSGQWIRSNVFQPVWDRLLGWMTPETTSEPKIDVALGYNAGRINVKLTDYGVEGAGALHVVNALVTRPDGSKVETTLSEDVPGELSGSIEAAQPGNYYFEVHAPFGKDQKFPPLAYTVSSAVNAEVPRPEPNFGLLEHLASATGGRLNPEPSEIATTRPVLERRESLNLYLILAAMIMLIAEALVRRLTA